MRRTVIAGAPPTWFKTAATEVDLISCATMFETLLIKVVWLHPGSHLDQVGVDTPSLRKVGAATILICSPRSFCSGWGGSNKRQTMAECDGYLARKAALLACGRKVFAAGSQAGHGAAGASYHPSQAVAANCD